jgi:DNA topoisomerase-2
MADLDVTYQMKSDIEHVLTAPDTYIGSVEIAAETKWVFNSEAHAIEQATVEFLPGLLKLFDEAVVNCRDHVIRTKTAGAEHLVTRIEVTIAEDGTITLLNDGNGIDVAKHPTHDLWIPEMVFGHLRTSTNYNREEKRIVGGKNGYGVKVIFIWSADATVETVDHTRGLKYVQQFSNNLDVIHPPKITKAKSAKPYTKITFLPDYARFGLPAGLSDGMRAVMHRRVYDIAAVTDPSVKVKLNGVLLPVRQFHQYVDLYVGPKSTTPRAYEQPNARWEYAVALTPNEEFVHVSFVNGIHTPKGGKHIDYILGQITRKLIEYIDKKKKVRVSPSAIKEQLVLFLRCDLENPTFQGQAKEEMSSPYASFGSRCEVSDKFVEKLANMGVMTRACAINTVKQHKAVERNDGAKTRHVTGVPKLKDAEFAGTAKSHLTTFIITEGDSALASLTSGMTSEDRETFGIWPARGKLLNVRNVVHAKLAGNETYADLKKILGLEANRAYATQEEVDKHLRYSRVRFLTDQDLDGTHIKGLFVNFFHALWPQLAALPGFLGYMNTPIVTATKRNVEHSFYHMSQYHTWQQAEPAAHTWAIKYYKGLGTSSKKEFQRYMRERNFKLFAHTGAASNDAIDMAFNGKRAADRKKWLSNPDEAKEQFVDPELALVPYEEFVNKDLILFSIYNNERNIANVVDGLKTSLRKIVHDAFRRNLTKEIKVAQFSGSVSEHTHYRHGEEALNKSIISLNQTFLGSSNVNLLQPSGQFGTRMMGGSDAAAPRYIFTSLAAHTRLIFPARDDPVLAYQTEDQDVVEPVVFAPIIPTVLVNGSHGIGTGHSSDVPCYNKYQVMDAVAAMLRGETYATPFLPFYETFRGNILPLNANTFLVKGCYVETGPDALIVTELPVGTWTQPYFEWLQKTIALTSDEKEKNPLKEAVKNVVDKSTDEVVEIHVTFHKGKLAELSAQSTGEGTCANAVEKLLHLTDQISTGNMTLFDSNERLRRYDTVQDILQDFFVFRYDVYGKRKVHEVASLKDQASLVGNKLRYIEATLTDRIDLRRKTPEQIEAMLEGDRFDKVEGTYRYLTNLPMDAVSEAKVARLQQEHKALGEQLAATELETVEHAWLAELDALRALFVEEDAARDLAAAATATAPKKVTKKRAPKR